MDISNIYDLPEEQFIKYQENPFPDDEIRPGLKEFAKKNLCFAILHLVIL